MKKNIAQLLNWLSLSCLYLIVFCVPLFFLPFTQEKYEINKYFLFYSLVLISFLSYLGRIAIVKTVTIKRTIIDISVVILWIGFLIISLISDDKYLSFVGDLGFLGFSFIGISLLIVFYFLLIQQISKISHVLCMVYTFLCSGFLSAFYFVLQVLNLVDFSRFSLPSYNPVSGSNTVFGIFMCLVFLISWGLFTIRKQVLWLDIFTALVGLMSLATIVLIGFNIVWIVLIISLIIILVFLFTNLEQTRSAGTSFGLIILVASILFVLLGQPKFLTAQLPTEVSLNSSTSWSIAVSTLTVGAKNFIFGSGPATFIYDFSQFRPNNLNLSFVWNTRFNQPYSAVFEWLSTNGVLVTIILFVIILLVLGVMFSAWLYQIKESKKKKIKEGELIIVKNLENSPLLFWVLSGAWLSVVLSLFFINPGAVHWIIFWMLTALVLTVGCGLSKISLPSIDVSLKTSPQFALLTSFIFILAFTAVIVLGVYLGRFYAGEVVYNRSLSESTDKKIESLQKAISFNGQRVQFYLAAAQSFLNKAEDIADTSKDSNLISQYVAMAVNAAKNATDQSPKNVASWEFLSAMYSAARPIAPEAGVWTIEALDKASVLEPTNPNFYLAKGNIKLSDKQYGEALEDFEKAIALKPDLLMAYVHLANLFEVQDKLDDSITTLTRGLDYGRQNPEYLFQVGRYYFNRNAKDDPALAERFFKAAIQSNPNYSDAYYALALLYEKNGFKTEAAKLYNKVLELNPDNQTIKDKIAGVGNLNTEISTSTPQTPIIKNK